MVKAALLSILGWVMACYYIIVWAQAAASQFRFVNFSYKDGLNEKIVYNAAQDKQGFMWFATASGLYQYDGHSFKLYRSPLDKPGSTIGNVLQGIMTDDEGNLWLGSYTSLQWYNPAIRAWWQPHNRLPLVDTLMKSYIVNFSKGRYIWVSTNQNYVYRFSRTDSSFLPLAPNYPAGASKSSIFTTEANGYLFDVHPEGIYRFGLEGGFLAYYPFANGDIANACFNQQDTALYLATYTHGLQKFNTATYTYTPLLPALPQLKQHNLLSVYKDGAGRFYAGSYPLHVMDANGLNYVAFKPEATPGNDFLLEANKIVNLVPDKEGNLWLCGHSGLSMLPWQNTQIKSYRLIDEQTGVVTEPIGVYHHPGSDYFYFANTTSRGLQVLNLRSGQISTLLNPLQKNMDEKRIIGLIAAPDGQFYGGDDTWFFKVEERQQKLIPFTLTDQHNKPITGIARNVLDQQGKIFIGSLNNGFYIWHYARHKLLHYHKWEVVPGAKGKEDDFFYPTLVDKNNDVWFVAKDGIYQYQQAAEKFMYYHPANNANMPMLNNASYIAQDANGHYWITSTNNGLYELFFDNQQPIWRNYTTQSGIGLPSDYCIKIKAAPNDSCLWISSGAGLLRFNPHTKRVMSVITEQNGLSSHGHGYGFNVFDDHLLVQLFYGQVNVIDLARYKYNGQAPVVAIQSLKVLGYEWAQKLASGQNKWVLSHNENYLQIEFASPSYNNVQQYQYMYMLSGADNAWINSGRQNTVSYSNLKPGQYIFKVKAVNNDGVEGPVREVAFTVKQPWYTSPYFLMPLGVLVLAGGWWWQRQRIKRIRLQEKQKAATEKQMAEIELKALRAQMNPHFIFNSLNSIQKYIFSNNQFEASQYLTKFSRLIRLILDQSHQNTISLSSEIELLTLYLEMESLRFENKFDFELVVDPSLSTHTLALPSMLIQPYVENAIWHGLLHKKDKGLVKVIFSLLADNCMEVIVEDNGIGRAKAAEWKSKQVLMNKSYGMQITSNRIAAINRLEGGQAAVQVIDLCNENTGLALGTRVWLKIPLKQLKD